VNEPPEQGKDNDHQEITQIPEWVYKALANLEVADLERAVLDTAGSLEVTASTTSPFRDYSGHHSVGQTNVSFAGENNNAHVKIPTGFNEWTEAEYLRFKIHAAGGHTLKQLIDGLIWTAATLLKQSMWRDPYGGDSREGVSS
jgi:hypothetical protein